MDALTTLFDPHIVIVRPKYQQLASGITACIASYRDFHRASPVHDESQTELSAHDDGDLALVTCGWKMEYE